MKSILTSGANSARQTPHAKLRTASAALFVIGALMSTASADLIAGTYTFTGSTGNVASFAYNGNLIPGITVSNLTKVGVTTRSGSGAFVATGWTDGATHFENTFTGGVDTDRYFEFTLTADAGLALNLTSLDFGLRRDANGTRQFEWRSSVDGFSSAISTYAALSSGLSEDGGIITAPDISSGWLGISLDLSDDAFAGHESVTFRFYAYNAELISGLGGLTDSLSFTAEAITVVPEPSTYGLIMGAGLVVFFFARGRKAITSL